LRQPLPELGMLTSWNDLGAALNPHLDLDRDAVAALTEYVGGALRTSRGLSLSRIKSFCRDGFQLRPALLRGITEKMVILDEENDCLRLDPTEWFRENAWAVEVLLSCDSTYRL
jgi:hypothetical protein